MPTADAQPSGITADQEGNVYFTEAANGAPGLGRLAPNGTIVEFTVPTPNANVFDLTIDPNGNLWYAGFASNKVGKVVIATRVIYLPIVRR